MRLIWFVSYKAWLNAQIQVYSLLKQKKKTPFNLQEETCLVIAACKTIPASPSLEFTFPTY